MADNTVTLILDDRRVSLAEFAKGVAAFSELVSALAVEVGHGEVDVVLDDLQFSSAIATARVEGGDINVSRVVGAFAEVGATLESHGTQTFGARVQKAVDKVVAINVAKMRFETASRDAVIPLKHGNAIPEQIAHPSTPSLQIVRRRKPAFGGVKGRIETLTRRNGLRFTLYDIHQDKAVSCYFEEGKQDLLRDLWGRLAIVEGIVSRDPVNGRPIAIREVRDITPYAEPSGKRDYQQARGAAPSLSGMSAVDAIRRVRDAD